MDMNIGKLFIVVMREIWVLTTYLLMLHAIIEMRFGFRNCVATATLDLIGFSHPKARYFSLLRKPQGCGECRKRRSGFLPKKSIRKKGDPDAACFLPRPCGLCPTKMLVLGAAYGRLSLPP